MCTLIVGRDILGPGTVIAAANRDEDPARPSDPPGVLGHAPRVVGGRDRVAGGTWLAIRQGFAMVALMNRRPNAAAAPGAAPAVRPRSRGLLALEVASALSADRAEFPAAARAYALRLAESVAYAPFSLVVLSAGGGWVLGSHGGRPEVTEIGPGWHVLTHADLDDPNEPRTARLARELRGWAPATLDAARDGLAGRLGEHAGDEGPAVCIHEGRMVTVSASIVYLGPAASGYWHAEGRPCERPFRDLADLLEDRESR